MKASKKRRRAQARTQQQAAVQGARGERVADGPQDEAKTGAEGNTEAEIGNAAARDSGAGAAADAEVGAGVRREQARGADAGEPADAQTDANAPNKSADAPLGDPCATDLQPMRRALNADTATVPYMRGKRIRSADARATADAGKPADAQTDADAPNKSADAPQDGPCATDLQPMRRAQSGAREEAGGSSGKGRAGSVRRAAAVRGVPLAAFLCVTFAFYELVLRLVTVERFWGVGVALAPLFAVPVALLLWLLCSCFAPCGARGVLSCAAVCTGVGYLLFASQMVYHAVFHTYYTLFSAGRGAQVTEFMGVILSTIARQSGWLLLLALPTAALAVLWKKGLVSTDCAVRAAAREKAQAQGGASLQDGGAQVQDGVSVQDRAAKQYGVPMQDDVSAQSGVSGQGSASAQDDVPLQDGALTKDSAPMQDSAPTQDNTPVQIDAQAHADAAPQPASSGRRVRLRVALLAFAVQFAALCALPLCGFGQNTPFALYFQTRVLTESVDKLGLLTTLRHDATDLIFGFDEAAAPGVDVGTLTVKDYTSDTEAETGADGSGASQAAVVGNPDFVRRPQTLDIDFSALADAEPNGAIAQLHREIAAREPTYTNAKTGLFEGKNLIYIVAESFSPYAISETLTPTLYKMQHDGWYFPRFYTGVWGVSTLDGEYVADVGLVPKQGVWSMYLSAFNTLPFTLGNAFRADGASTYAYHNGLYDYYSRQDSHPNLGYTYKGVYGGLTMTDEWPRSDNELVDITVDEYVNDDYFHVYYLTISGHLPYDASDKQAMKHAAAVADLPYSQHVKNYLAANIELDKAMETLLARLTAAGRLDDTVIVMSPDHYPYGLTNAEISELAGHTVETEFELHKSSLILYHAPTQGETVTKACSSLDLVPTMLNLFGLPYDARLLAGRDIFSDGEGFVPLVTKSFLTDTVQYNAVTNEATPLTPEGVNAEYVAQRSAYLSQIFTLSRRILETNYYSYLPPEAVPAAAAAP